jgi:small subunit ribosomal protein S27e
MPRKGLIPKPESKFIKVKCPKCGNEETVFDRSSIAVKCGVCEEILAEPKGGKSSLRAEVVQVL